MLQPILGQELLLERNMPGEWGGGGSGRDASGVNGWGGGGGRTEGSRAAQEEGGSDGRDRC
jgi:hypothetical protein